MFIVGSMIVSFLIYPQSFNQFKSNVESFVPSPSVKENSFRIEVNNTCTNIEITEQLIDVYGLKKKGCIELCGEKDKSYITYKCENNKLVCYCNLK